jgi:hypothetical protein
MNAKTEAKLNEILAAAKAGHEIIPMFFQRGFGIDASVSAAIRVAKSRGLLVQSGVDGCGKPKYRIAVPAATHASSAAIN